VLPFTITTVGVSIRQRRPANIGTTMTDGEVSAPAARYAPSADRAPLRHPRTWRSALVRASIAYVFSRLCVLAGAGILAATRVVAEANEGLPRPSNAVGKILDVLTSWDGLWYFAIVRGGYPSQIPADVTFHQLEARAAFYPVYPLLTDIVDVLLPGGDVAAGLALNALLGLVAVVLVGFLARDIFGEEVAYRSMLLAALFPGSFVLSFAYSEATLMVLAAASLWMLVRRNWLWAGVFAAVGTATRPNAIALVIACAVASFVAIRRDRDWRSLAAPALAPVGVVAFHLYLWVHTGETSAWLRVQTEAWDEGTSFGLSAVRGTVEALAHPLSSPTDMITLLTVGATIMLGVAAWKRRLPPELVAFALVVLVMMIMPTTVTARPRFLYTAFPLLIALAAWIPEDDDDRWTLLMSAGAAGLVTLTGVYGAFGAIP
jgi:hypothetical protein